MRKTIHQQDQLYRETADLYSAALQRLARGYEAAPDRRLDLLQDINFALWQSFATFDGKCSLRTWVYRVAHNTATSYVLKQRRTAASTWVTLDDEMPSDAPSAEEAVHGQQALSKLLGLVQSLQPSDRQIILLFLEDLDNGEIAQVTGLKPAHIATKIHRIKALLRRQFHQGASI